MKSTASYIRVLFAACFVTSIIGLTNGQLFEDESCQLENKSTGKCKAINNCQVFKDMDLKQRRPVVCSYNQSNVIVCCPDEATAVVGTEEESDTNAGMVTSPPELSMSIGSPCTMKNGSPGNCNTLESCPETNNLTSGEAPKLCYFENLVAVVCCPRFPLPPRGQHGHAGAPPNRRPAPPDAPKRTPAPHRQPSRPALGASAAEAPQPERTSAAKCREYSRSVYQVVQDPVLFVIPQMQNQSQCNSPMRKNQPPSRDVSEVKIKEFPHITPLGYGDLNNITWSCVGSLISEKFILTAGSCINLPERGEVKWARVGDMEPTVQSPNSRPVQKVVETFVPRNNRHTLALLKLEKKVDFSGFTRPACLSTTPGLPAGYRFATTAGWGLHLQDRTLLRRLLMKQDLLFTQNQQCKGPQQNRGRRQNGDRISNRPATPPGICVRNPQQDDVSPCVGEMGSPLYIVLETPHCMASIIGVNTSGMRGCPNPNRPGFFTRVSDYVTWIESVVWS